MKAPWLPFSMFRAGGTFIFHSHGRWALEGWEGYLIYNRLKNCNIINILLLISFLKSSSFSCIGHCWFMLYLFLFLTRGLCFRRDLFISRLLCTYSYCSDDICSYDTCPTDNCSAWSDKYSGDKMLPERHLLLQKSNDSWSSKKKLPRGRQMLCRQYICYGLFSLFLFSLFRFLNVGANIGRASVVGANIGGVTVIRGALSPDHFSLHAEKLSAEKLSSEQLSMEQIISIILRYGLLYIIQSALIVIIRSNMRSSSYDITFKCQKLLDGLIINSKLVL